MTLSRPATAAALVGGAALTIDAIIIAVANSSFGAADSALWLIGLVGLIAAAALTARDGTPGLTGARRMIAGSGIAVGLIAVSALAMVALDGVGAQLSANRGVHDELGTFLVGLAWLLIALATGRQTRRTFAAAIGGILVALGFASSGQAQTAGPSVVTVSMPGTKLIIPARLSSGAVRIVASVAGRAPDRTLSFIRLQAGVSLAEALGRVASHRGDLDYLGGDGSLVLDAQMNRGRASAVVSLSPGRYVALDTTTPNPARWPSRTFTVTAAARPASLPTAGASVSMIDFGYRGATRLHEGELVRYVNDGFLTHMVLGLKVTSRAAARRVTADLMAGRNTEAEKLATSTYAFAGALSPGAEQEQPVATAPGIYVLGCFLTTQDGRDHTRLGMERTITVTP